MSRCVPFLRQGIGCKHIGHDSRGLHTLKTMVEKLLENQLRALKESLHTHHYVRAWWASGVFNLGQLETAESNTS